MGFFQVDREEKVQYQFMESSSSLGKQSDPDPTHHVYQVIIIGAGVSGLSAARHLQKNGITDFIVLEATGKAGGRIHSEKFGDGLIELGAQWIHGEQNEFCQLVKATNHRHAKTSWEGKGDFLCPNGSKIENSLVDEVLGWIEDEIEKVESRFSIETLQDENGIDATQPISMGKHLLSKFYRYLKERHPDFEESSPEYALRMALFQWGMSFQRIDNSCHGMNDVSLYRWSEFEVNPGEHYNNFAKGAQSFVDEVLVGGGGEQFLKPHLIYNSAVKNINWDSNVVKVTTTGGSIYIGDIVVLTVSVGVLKTNLETLFTPHIPNRLSNAIQRTGYFGITKIFLEWPEPWWPSDLKGFQLVWPGEYLDCCEGAVQHGELDDSWHKAITGFDPVLDNPNVLLAWLGGPEALYVETLTNQQVMSRCVQVLRDFTRYDVSPPENVVVSKWSTNKFFQGAYSFRSVDGDCVKGDICATLCDPIVVADEFGGNKPVIILAGEALSKTHYSTLHGAYESGISQAAKIVQYFNSTLRATSSRSSYANDHRGNKSNSVSSPVSLSETTKKSVSVDENETANFKISALALNKDVEVPS